MAKMKRKRHQLSPTQIIAVTFAAIIFVGTVLLALPVAARSGESIGVINALFTATSATCVTGLTVGDTYSLFSGFGQIVIIMLIEIGGLGFMSAASLVIFVLRKKIGLRQRMVMAQALSVNEMESVVRLQKWVLLGSLIIQFTGAMILFLRFLPDYGWSRAAKWGIFHAISAFCNAGFDIFGYLEPGMSLVPLRDDPVVLITLILLITVGGLGFFVWEEVLTRTRMKRLSAYTKLVLLMTVGILVVGTGLFLVLEWNNPETLGGLSVGSKILNGIFQTTTLRTAGFFTVDQAGLTDAGKAVSMVIMLIGGSSGSTAGGVKTVTFLVLILFLFARSRGQNTVNVFKRSIPQGKILDAATIVSIMVAMGLLGAIVITATCPVSFTDALFEAVSALSTAGVTAGATPLLTIPAQLMIIVFMYFGRVGILTISLGFLAGNKAEDRYRYADANLLIG